MSRTVGGSERKPMSDRYSAREGKERKVSYSEENGQVVLRMSREDEK